MISITNNEFKELTDYIKDNYGINLTQKKTLIEGRLSNMIVDRGFRSFSDYLEHVFSDKSKNEVTLLVNKLTTNHTFFMREADHFDYFRDTVLPYLESKVRQRDLRVWSAGCSSGEEPYTLAMLMADYFGAEKHQWDTKVLATDISVKVLETAEKGIYPAESVNSLPGVWRLNYFKKMDSENFQVLDAIRKEVIYRIFNLMDAQFPFKKKFHVIFCRNVMIYFDKETKLELIRKFYELTEPGGFLFIGHSESIDRGETGYSYVKPAVYRKG